MKVIVFTVDHQSTIVIASAKDLEQHLHLRTIYYGVPVPAIMARIVNSKDWSEYLDYLDFICPSDFSCDHAPDRDMLVYSTHDPNSDHWKHALIPTDQVPAILQLFS